MSRAGYARLMFGICRLDRPRFLGFLQIAGFPLDVSAGCLSMLELGVAATEQSRCRARQIFLG